MIYPLANLFGEWNWILIVLVGLLLFGKRLPEMGRSLGKGIVEFKKGLNGIEEEIEQASRTPGGPPATPSIARLPAAQPSDSTTRAALDAGYKFDPYTGKPLSLDPVTGRPMRFDPYTGKPISQEAPTAPGVGADV
jgi:TatA/E family protein of Tat protein translocase